MLTIRATGTQLTALYNTQRNGSSLFATTNRLATGSRLNSGSDDPAGLIAATDLRGDLADLSAQQRSLGYERNQINVQQSGRTQAAGLLNEVRGLVVQATGDTVSAEQRSAIQGQIDSALDGLDRIATATGISFSSDLQGLRAGGDASVVDGDPAAAAELVEQELSSLTTAAAEAGAYRRYTLDVDQRLAEDQEVLAAQALSQIADADYAAETADLARNEILLRASIQTLGAAGNLRAEGLITLLDTLA